MKLLTEIPAMVRFIFETPPPPSGEDLVPKKMEPSQALSAMKEAHALLADLPGTDEEAEGLFRALAEKLGIKLGDLLAPVRVAVTGSKVSPPLLASIRVMGIEKARERTAAAIQILETYTTRR